MNSGTDVPCGCGNGSSLAAVLVQETGRRAEVEMRVEGGEVVARMSREGMKGQLGVVHLPDENSVGDCL